MRILNGIVFAGLALLLGRIALARLIIRDETTMLRYVLGGLSLLAFMLSGCSSDPTTPDEILRYKLVVTLAASGKTISAAAVQELGFYEGSGLGRLLGPAIPSRITVGVRGEALLADLGEQGALIVPLTRGGAEMGYEGMIFWACAGLQNEEWSAAYIARVTPLLRAGCDVPPRALPMFIWMPNLESQSGFKRVRPDALASVLGARLMSVRLEATEEPPSSGIRDYLPWLESLLVPKGGLLPSVVATDEPLDQHLRYRDFRKDKFL
jgi:hypothetical protein